MLDMTPEQWRDKLVADLAARQADITRRRNYYDGKHLHPLAPKTDGDEYLRLAVLGEANLIPNIVDAVVDRSHPDGIMLTGKVAEDAAEWERMWHGNGLETTFPMVFEETVKVGWAYTMTWPDDDSDVGVSITGEDPTECIVGYHPADRRRAEANLKRFVAGDGAARTEYVILWTRTGIYYWQRSLTEPAGELWLPSGGSSGQWRLWGGPDDGEPVRDNPLGDLPLDEFTSKPKLYGPIQPEISDVAIRTTDRMNLRMFNSVVLGEHQAYPQRVALNIEIKTDKNGNPINPLKSGPDRVWTLNQDPETDAAAQITTLTAADMTQGINVLRFDIQLLAMQTRTPMYELAGDLVNIAEDTVKALGVSHVKKVRRHHANATDPLQGIVRKYHLARGNKDLAARANEAIVQWADPELRTMNERADAATKLTSVGYPFEAVASKAMGESPTEIAKLLEQKAAESVLGLLGGQAVSDPEDMQKRITSMKLLIDAGVTPTSAAEQVGLSGLEFTSGNA
ncbi:MAG: phage portal protein [Ilumatobacter sp.]|nr:phage portal protein [Ilumatobacter sp.]